MSDLGSELKEMVSLIERQQNLITSLGEKGAHLDERKDTLSKEVEDLRKNLHNVSSELTKANDTIRKLQGEGVQMSRTLKTQENILTSQEAQLKAKEDRLIQTSAGLNGATERVAKLESELEIANLTQNEMKERIKVLEDSLTMKESMATYLSKQVLDSEAILKQLTEEATLLRDNNKKLETELSDIHSGHGTLGEQFKLAEDSLVVKDSMISALTKKLEDSEDLSKLMSHEIQNLRRNNGKLDADYHEKQRALNNLLAKAEAMEVELRDKTGLIGRQQDLVANLGEKGASLESRKESLEREVDSLKIHERELSNELGKANEIIRKLQEDGRNLTRRINTQDTILNSQENQLKCKTDGLTKSSSALKSATERLAKLESEVDQLNVIRTELGDRLKLTEETLSGKENMVTYLSKKLNDYEGLANLDKFRQTLSLSTTQNQDMTNDSKNQNTTVPSWMHMYHSTFGSSNPPSGNKEVSESKKKPAPVRAPAWTKSNKATLDNLLSKPLPKK